MILEGQLNSLYFGGKYDKVTDDHYKRISDSKNFGLFNSRGMCFYKQGEQDKAIKDYTQAIKLNPEEGVFFNNRGVSWSKKGEYGEAIKDYTQAIKLNIDFPQIFWNMGEALYGAGKFKESQKYLKKHIASKRKRSHKAKKLLQNIKMKFQNMSSTQELEEE